MASVLTSAPPQGAPSGATPSARPKSVAVWLLAGTLAALVVCHLPALVCLPPDPDASFYDVMARTAMWGGVLYRDALDTNLPGMPWAHMAVRSLFGWRSEPLLAADAVVAAALVALLTGWLPSGSPPAARWGAALALGGFYLGLTEWCHVQRDFWMLLPALLALGRRRRALRALAADGPSAWGFGRLAVAEGVLWGTAFWFKPHVAVPAVCALAFGAREARQRGAGSGAILRELTGVLTGGLLVGAAGSAWLVGTGAWSDFWEVVTVWNREYVGFDLQGRYRWFGLFAFGVRFFPWLFLHALAVPFALAALWRGGRASQASGAPGVLLLPALYLGWLLQAAVLQQRHDYVHAPAILLAVAVVCQRCAAGVGERRVLAFLLTACLALWLPKLTVQRAALWAECLRHGGTPEVRDQLSQMQRMSWRDLERVEEFLRGRNIQDGELTCVDPRSLSLHLGVGRRPATRYLLTQFNLRVFARHRERICADLVASRQRFVVVDVVATPWRGGQPPDVFGFMVIPHHEDDPENNPFPRERLAFRAGRYAVYELDGASLPSWLAQHVEDE